MTIIYIANVDAPITVIGVLPFEANWVDIQRCAEDWGAHPDNCLERYHYIQIPPGYQTPPGWTGH